MIGSSHLCVQGAGAPGTQSQDTSGGSGGNDPFAEYGGIDPSVDPEMAMVMRMSLMEARQNQQGGGEEKVEDKSDDAPSAAVDSSKTEDTSTAAPTTTGTSDGMSDSQLLQQALALSMAGGGDTGSKMDEDEEDEDEDEDEDDEEEDDDADLRAALLMSQGLAADSTAPSIPAVDSTEGKSEDDSAATPGNFSFNDPDFVQNMLRGLPGVDPDDERIKAALAQISGNKRRCDKDKKKGR